MAERVAKVVPLASLLPQDVRCLEDIFYDRQGMPRRVCGPVVTVLKSDRKADCGDDAHPVSAWHRSFCRGAGTGVLVCADGQVALSRDAGLGECHVEINEHVPPISAQ